MTQQNIYKIFILILVITFSFNTFAQENDKTVKQLIEKGAQLGMDGKYEEALRTFKEAQKLSPQNPAVFNGLGMSYLHLKKYKNAIENLDKAIELAPNNDLIRINLCITLAANKQSNLAVQQCQEAVNLNPESSKSRYLTSHFLRIAGRLDEAIAATEESLIDFPEDEKLLNFLISANIAKSNFQRALEILEKLVEIKPDVSDYQVELSQVYLMFDRVDDAVKTANKAIKLNVLNPFAYYRLAKVYHEIAMYDEAISTLHKAVELKPNAGEIYFLYGQSLSKTGNASQAIVNLREAVRLMPDYVPALFTLGQILTEDGRFAEAVEPLRKAEKLRSNDLEIKTNLGLALFESGNFDEALKYLLEADKLKPKNEVIQMFINVTKSRKKGIADIENVKRFVASNPNDGKTKMYLANLYQYSGNIPEATKLMLESFNQQSETFELNNNLGVFFTETRRYDLAIKYTKRAIELKQHHVLYLSLAGNLKRLGKIDEALEAFKKALEIKADSTYALKGFADTLKDHGKKREAIEIYKKLVEIEPNNSAALFNLSLLHLDFLDKPTAQIYYEKLLQTDKNLARNLSWIFRIKN